MSDASPPAPAAALGDVLLGRYRLERVIGEGGTGVVYAARDSRSGTQVAIKLLRRALETEELRTRFIREARATGKLAMNHVVRVLDAGALEERDRTPYMVMELLEGRDLARVLAEDGTLPLEQAIECMMQVCGVLREAHARGIVHRDLKPANLFLTRQEPGIVHVKVLDFGISKVFDRKLVEEDGQPEVTVPYVMLGSPRYMAPEQIRNSKEVDARADLWSVGAVLFQLLTGVHVFEASGTVQASVAALSGEPRRLEDFFPNAPPGLGDVIRRCLAKDRDARYQSAGELAAALRPFAPRPGSSTMPLAPVVDSARARRGTVPTADRPSGPPPPSSARNRSAPVPAIAAPSIAQPPTVEAWGRSDAPPRRGGRPWMKLASGALGGMLVGGVVVALIGLRLTAVHDRGRHALVSAGAPATTPPPTPATASVATSAGTPSSTASPELARTDSAPSGALGGPSLPLDAGRTRP